MYQKQFSRACYLMLIVTLCCSGRMRNRSRSTLPSWARSLIPLELPCRMLPLRSPTRIPTSAIGPRPMARVFYRLERLIQGTYRIQVEKTGFKTFVSMGVPVSEAQTVAHFRSWAPITAVQLEYSLLERTAEGELIPMAQEMGMGVMPWSPLKHGVIDALCAVADEVGATTAAVALAWVRSRPGVASTIIGARSPAGPA